jgi:hypothetical protein
MVRTGRKGVPRRRELRYKFLWPEAATSVENEVQSERCSRRFMIVKEKE